MDIFIKVKKKLENYYIQKKLLLLKQILLIFHKQYIMDFKMLKDKLVHKPKQM